MNTKQSGFSNIAIVIVLVVLGVIGFTGYRIYEKNNTQLSVVDSNGKRTYVPKGKLVFEANESLYEVGVDGTNATTLVNKLHAVSGSDESSVLSNDGRYIAYFTYKEPKMVVHVVATDNASDIVADTFDESADNVQFPFYGWVGDKIVYSVHNETDHHYSIKVFDTSEKAASVVFQTANDYDFSEALNAVHVLNDSIVFMHGYQLTYIKMDGPSTSVVKDFSQDFVNASPNEQLMLMRNGINTFNVGVYNNDASKADKYYTYLAGGIVKEGTDTAVLSNFLDTFIFDYAASQINIPQSPSGRLAWLDASKKQIMISKSDGSNAEPLTIQTNSSEVFYPYKFIGDDYLIVKTNSDNEHNFYVVSTKGGVPTKLGIVTATKNS